MKGNYGAQISFTTTNLFAAELLFHQVIVEADALSVVTGLKSELVPQSYLGSICSDCKMLEAHFLNVSYSHIGRKCNSVAHGLAKYALDHPSQTWIEEVPPMVSHCVITDFCPIV